MKQLFYLFIGLLLLTSCNSKLKSAETEKLAEKMRQIAQLDLPKSSSIQLAEDVKFLSSDELMGRDTGSAGIELAAVFLEDRFKELGIQPFYDDYRDNFGAKGEIGSNILAVLPGSDGELKKEVVVIGAHYDHIGLIKAVAGDSIANGANDNASGTATVLAMAKIMKEFDFNRRTVVFALFSAEEKGLLGSTHLAKRMQGEGINVVAMLNFEMTGVPMVDSPHLTYLTGYDTSNMGAIFNQANSKTVVTGKLEAAARYQLFRRSDNYPFFEVFGVPSQTFCTFDFTNFDHYHKVGDEIDEIDARHMADVVDALMPGVLNIANKNDLKLTPKTDE